MAIAKGRQSSAAAAAERAATGPPVALRPWTDHLALGEDPSAFSLNEPGTLVHAFLQGWSDSPDDPLLLGEPGTPAWSNARFEEASRRAACCLLGAGLEPGDRVVWAAEPTPESLVANVACLRAGLVVVPVDPAATQSEVGAVARVTEPRGTIATRTELAGWARDALGQAPFVVARPDVDLPEAPRFERDLDGCGPDDPALIGMTSGTTGRPKGAVLTQRNLAAGALSLRSAWRWTPEDRLVHSLPLFHAHGLCVGAYGTMATGASTVILGRFDPGRVGDAAASTGATLFFGVPTMYHRLVQAGIGPDLRGLRLCVSGSAPMSRALHDAASDALGMQVLERYGMTETLMLTSNPYEGERRPGTVGFPLPGVEVRLDHAAVAEDIGDRAEPGLGEVWVRGPSVFDGYLSDPAVTATAFAGGAEGGRPWFRTGDLGVVEDGYLAIRGRAKELIITGGHNVHPGEVEDVLSGCPGVSEVAVSGTASDEYGEVVTAWVVPDGRAPSLEELTGFAAGSLAPYKRPRLLHVVDSLPRNALGKVVRAELGAAGGSGRS